MKVIRVSAIFIINFYKTTKRKCDNNSMLAGDNYTFQCNFKKGVLKADTRNKSTSKLFINDKYKISVLS